MAPALGGGTEFSAVELHRAFLTPFQMSQPGHPCFSICVRYAGNKPESHICLSVETRATEEVRYPHKQGGNLMQLQKGQ